MNYKSEDLKVLGGVLVMLAIIGLFVVSIVNLGNRLSEVNQEIEKEPEIIIQVEEDYLPESFKNSFLSGCLEEDFTQYDYCLCTFNYLDRNFTNKEVIDMSFEMELTGDITDEMFDAVSSCINSYIY